MRVDPQDAALPLHAREPGKRPECDGVVAPENQGKGSVLRRLRHEVGDPPARLLDLWEEACSLVAW